MSSAYSKPPAGGDRNIGPNLEAAALATILIAAIVVVARFYARLRVVRNVGWDDWLMLLALVCGMPVLSLSCHCLEEGDKARTQR